MWSIDSLFLFRAVLYSLLFYISIEKESELDPPACVYFRRAQRVAATASCKKNYKRRRYTRYICSGASTRERSSGTWSQFKLIINSRTLRERTREGWIFNCAGSADEFQSSQNIFVAHSKKKIFPPCEYIVSLYYIYLYYCCREIYNKFATRLYTYRQIQKRPTKREIFPFCCRDLHLTHRHDCAHRKYDVYIYIFIIHIKAIIHAYIYTYTQTVEQTRETLNSAHTKIQEPARADVHIKGTHRAFNKRATPLSSCSRVSANFKKHYTTRVATMYAATKSTSTTHIFPVRGKRARAAAERKSKIRGRVARGKKDETTTAKRRIEWKGCSASAQAKDSKKRKKHGKRNRSMH